MISEQKMMVLLIITPAISKPLSKHTNDSAVSTLNTYPHSFTTRQGVLTEPLMRNYLFIFYKHLPLAFLFPVQFSSLGLQLWHCQSVGVIPQKAGKARCWDEERLLSHISRCIAWNAGPAWTAEAATHTMISEGAAVFES